MKLGLAIRQVTSADSNLADELLAVGERHRIEHDVYHVTNTMATILRGHVERLEPFAERYEASVKGDPDEGGRGAGGLLSAVREKGAQLVGRRPEAGLLLLGDLRTLHLMAAEASINWLLLGQGAQAAKDTDLVAAVSDCHPETLRTLRWTTTRLKEIAPQVLTS